MADSYLAPDEDDADEDVDTQTPEDDGDTYDLGDDDRDVIDTPDGGALVKVGDKEPPVEKYAAFFVNLADTTNPKELAELDAIAFDLIDKIQNDIESRKTRDEQQAEGLKRTGFTDKGVGGADFDGSSKVVHPMIGKASIEFSAKVMKELFPPDGPVKDKIVGEVTSKKQARAERKTTHMNWQLTEQIIEFRACLEQMLTQVPPGGAQYMKFYWDDMLQRPAADIIWIDHMVLPYGAKSFMAARRRTHRRFMIQEEFQNEVDRGWYLPTDVIPIGTDPEETETQERQNKIEGQEQTGENQDDMREIYEVYAWLQVDFEDERPEKISYAPYIIAVDPESNKMLCMYRNWDPAIAEERGVVQEIQHIVEFPFIPWRGAYPLGIYHLIGGISTAATGALRALLDAAHFSNSQTLLKLKSGMGGQNLSIKQTGIQEIAGNISTDDIRKLAMPLPFNPPSAVLYELLGFLTAQAESVVRTSLDDEADMSPNAPVGTTMARVEQGMVVFSAIHGRMHASFAQLLKILHRINRDHMTKAAIHEDTGESMALPADYQGPIDVVPVSDPNIFSEMQRYGQLQAIAARATGNPLYDQAKVEERILKGLKIPNPEELLVTPPSPDSLDPVSENVSMALGKPATAFPNQDHVAHLRVHLAFTMDDMLGLNLLIAPTLIPPMLQHLKEHLLMMYAKNLGDLVHASARKSMSAFAKDDDPKVQASLARALAAASKFIPEQRNNYATVVKAAQHLIQMMQQIMPPQPQDPTVAAAASAKAETDRRAQRDQADVQLKSGELKLKAGELQQRGQLEQAGMQSDQQAGQQELKVHAMLEQAKLQQGGQLEQAKLQQAGDLAKRDQAIEVTREGMVHSRTLEAERGDQARDAAQLTLEANKQRADQQDAAVQAGLERQKTQQDGELKQMQERMKMAMNNADNVTALKIAMMEIASAEKVAVENGHGINPE